MIKILPFLQKSSGDKKSKKNTIINHQNGGGRDNWLLENGADLSRLMGMGSTQDEAPRVEE